MLYKTVLALLIAAATTGTALAQTTPAPVASPENPATTAAAQKFYASIAKGTPDRAHISGELNAALTDDLVKTLASQLTALGQPTWTFLRWESYSGENIAEYKLAYSSGTTLYYGFGAADDGTVNFARFTNQDM
jgi:hypothetical protein